MYSEVSEKDEKQVKTSVTIQNVPMTVHDRILQYRREIMADRKRDYTVMEAYVEYLIEKTTSDKPAAA